MKSLKIIVTALCIGIVSIASAQIKTQTLKVAGECGTCKKKIEAAAKNAGATYASWNMDSKLLTVKYNSTATNTAKIEHSIADTGYDTPDYKASDKAYNKLDGCYHYERTTDAKKACCDDARCTAAGCMRDGKCANDMSCCKEAGCDAKACCKKA